MDNLFDQNILSEIQKQFQKIKETHGIDSEESEKELEELFGVSFEELDEEYDKQIMIRNLKVNVTSPDAIFPKYNYATDSGFDLYSTETVILKPFGRALIPTGLRFGITENHEIQIRPKSGLAINQGITVLNTPGTVDQGYTGEIKVIAFNTNNCDVTIEKGSKIAQAVLCPVVKGEYVFFESVKSLDEADRGDNGFGSTGLK